MINKASSTFIKVFLISAIVSAPVVWILTDRSHEPKMTEYEITYTDGHKDTISVLSDNIKTPGKHTFDPEGAFYIKYVPYREYEKGEKQFYEKIDHVLKTEKIR